MAILEGFTDKIINHVGEPRLRPSEFIGGHFDWFRRRRTQKILRHNSRCSYPYAEVRPAPGGVNVYFNQNGGDREDALWAARMSAR